jgi:YD repeat-containing protein
MPNVKPLQYMFDLECPRCGATQSVTTENREMPRELNCSDCLMQHVEIVPVKILRIVVLSIVILMTMLVGVSSMTFAQDGAIYGPDGRVTARSSRSSDGSVTYYDAGGRVVARSTTDSSGTTTVYGADGRPASQIAPPAAGKGKR